MKKSFFIFALVSLFFISCLNIGLGEEIDLEAPVLTVQSIESDSVSITDFASGVYCKKNVTFKGLAKDNIEVSRVDVQVKWAGENDFINIGSAKLNGSDWSFSYNFEDEGACFVKFVAEDKPKNSSSKSFKTITLYVDQTAPVANAWYIDREISGIQYGLKSKEMLKSLDLSFPENKDAAQNVSFTICSNASDKFGIKAISIIIKDENGNKVAVVENSNSNNYAPKFKITHQLLTSGNPALATGKHYLQVFYQSEDVVEFPSSNVAEDVEVELGWFIWWPESDLPQISNTEIIGAANEASMNVHVKDVLNFTFFDDDELKEGYFALLTEDEADSFNIGWDDIKEDPQLIINAVKKDSANEEESDEDARKNRTAYFVADGERETVIVLNAAAEAQTMKLYAIGWDNTTDKKIAKKEIDVHVTDESTPILIISSPKTNFVPTFNEDKETTTVIGQTLDASGCEYLEFAWVPSSFADKKTAAQNVLEQITTESQHNTYLEKKTTVDGLVVWGVTLGEKVPTNGSYSQNFSFNINLLDDFVYNGTNEQAEKKYFLAKLTRKDGNYIYQEYNLSADDTNPTIVGVTPAADMQIFQDDADLKLSFYAKKDSGLAIDTSSYKIYRADVTPLEELSGSYNNETQRYETTISEETLKDFSNSGIRPKYRFYAKDIFGNENYEEYSISLSTLPVLKSVSSSSSVKSKKGDVIDIVASFSKTVGVSGTPYIKLKGITNTANGINAGTAVKAYYLSGSGTTTIHFTYKVQEGDSSNGLTLFDANPIEDNGSNSFVSTKVTIPALSTEENAACKNNFDAKRITVDGISPTITANVSSTGGITDGGITYLKEGTTLTVTLTASESVIVASPAPSIRLLDKTNNNNILELPFVQPTGSGASTKIIFSKTITSGDTNGQFVYKKNDFVKNASSITDSYQNELNLGDDTSLTDTKCYVDTKVPKTPVASATEELSDNTKYKDSVTITLTKKETDSTVKWLQYSKDGGSTWLPNNASTEGTPFTLTESASFTYRAVDRAGNVSTIPEPIYLDIERSFPDFSVECTKSDGNYKAGETLTFILSFVRPVNVPANSGAYITLSAASGTGGGNATLSSNAAQNNVESLEFTYTVKAADSFTLKVAKEAVHLTGVTDEYGIAQGTKQLSADYTRSIKCDGVAPSITARAGTSNVITFTFSEPVLKAGGNITIQRKGNWALPPVLSAEDFNKICNATSNPATTRNILSLQENGADMEDFEWVSGSNANYKNQYYHGTGQFVGPYKKTTQGILDSGEPDITTKYVLDFNMGIWETDTVHYYGKTFATAATSTQPSRPSETRTASQIRSALESAGYHKRVVDVTSSSVVVSGNTVTITFPKGLCDTSEALPLGIDWEVIVPVGCFMDETGNLMTQQYTKDFRSGGVEAPVVRVDRYSYGVGIYQPAQNGTTDYIRNTSATQPTGYVRVRIDCQSADAAITYTVDNTSSYKNAIEIETGTVEGGNAVATSTYNATSAVTKGTLNTRNLNTAYTKDSIFTVGNGKYNEACRRYIVAGASANGETSQKGYEGVFQTVVRIVDPRGGGNPKTSSATSDNPDFNIRGTTGWSGEPYISPFPLRDAQIGSPYLRLCFRERTLGGDKENSLDYYWLSYEILVDSSLSGTTQNGYIGGWGWVTVGGYSELSNMRTW